MVRYLSLFLAPHSPYLFFFLLPPTIRFCLVAPYCFRIYSFWVTLNCKTLFVTLSSYFCLYACHSKSMVLKVFVEQPWMSIYVHSQPLHMCVCSCNIRLDLSLLLSLLSACCSCLAAGLLSLSLWQIIILFYVCSGVFGGFFIRVCVHLFVLLQECLFWISAK